MEELCRTTQLHLKLWSVVLNMVNCHITYDIPFTGNRKTHTHIHTTYKPACHSDDTQWQNSLFLIYKYISMMPNNARFDVLTVLLLQIQVFWDVMQCHWANRCWHLQSQAIHKEVLAHCHSITSQKTWIFGAQISSHIYIFLRCY